MKESYDSPTRRMSVYFSPPVLNEFPRHTLRLECDKKLYGHEYILVLFLLREIDAGPNKTDANLTRGLVGFRT